MEEKHYKHKKARLITCKGDLSKKWYLDYQVWSVKRQKLVRKRYYKGFDKFNTYETRLKYGNAKCRELNNILPTSCIEPIETKENESVEQLPKQSPKKVNFFFKDLDDNFKILYKVGSASYKSYSSCLNLFEQWLKKFEFDDYTHKHFTKKEAQMYVDYLSRQGLTGKTVKNRVAPLKSICNKLIQREIIIDNPFNALEMPKIIQSDKNTCFSAEQIKEIKTYCQDNDKMFIWLFCQFIYYTYMRPVEISRLKMKHIDFSTSKIIVAGNISKSGKTQTIELPQALKTQLLEYVGVGYNDEHYLFTTKECPGPKKTADSAFAKLFLVIRRTLEINEKHTLYSWKHTGVVNAFKNGVNIKSVQMQCRHHSIEQTDVYLKSLGFMDNSEFAQGIPTI